MDATCKPPPGPRCLLLVKNFIPREIYVCGGIWKTRGPCGPHARPQQHAFQATDRQRHRFCGGDLVMELQKWGCVLTSSRSHFLIFICVKKSRIFCGLYNLISWYFLNSVIYIDLFVFYFSSHAWALLATWSRPAVVLTAQLIKRHTMCLKKVPLLGLFLQ